MRPPLPLSRLSLGLVIALAGSACGPRVIIATGTTIGLKATPGDPQAGLSPQVTLGYKRAELVLIATQGDGATKEGPDGKPGADAYSTLGSLGFKTTWFGDTELTSFMATGFAARGLTASDASAPSAAKADVPAPPTPAPAPTTHGRGPASVQPSESPAGGGTGNSFFDTMKATADKIVESAP